MSTIRTCPDCGGILEPSPAEWMSTIALASHEPSEAGDVVRWQCFICGYEEGPAEPDGRTQPELLRTRT